MPVLTASSFDRRIYAIAAVASLTLSLWGAWAEFVPNPDAALYLRAADLFAAGKWSAALATYSWPAYSILIATVMKLTGASAFIAAQGVNATASVVTTVAFMALVNRLANRDRLVFICAAIVILLQPQLVQLRSSIIRDNGYFACLFVTLYFVARDVGSPRLMNKLVIAAAIVLAGLFRTEGFYFGILVVIYYFVVQGGWSRYSAILAAIALAFGALLGLLLWRSGSFAQWLVGEAGWQNMQRQWVDYSNLIAGRLFRLKTDFLFPYGGGNSWGAYVGMVFGIATVNIVRALTIPLAILSVFAFFPKRLMPRPANEFVLWFTLGQLPVLLVFTFTNMLLDKRYAMGMALILSTALPFLLAASIRLWRSGAPTPGSARACLPVVAIVLVAPWAFSIPHPSKLAYLKEAGQWIGQQVPANARILTNDARIAYFSGRPYNNGIFVWPYDDNSIDAELPRFDYFAFKAKDAQSVPAPVKNIASKTLVRSFEGKDGDVVLVYERK